MVTVRTAFFQKNKNERHQELIHSISSLWEEAVVPRPLLTDTHRLWQRPLVTPRFTKHFFLLHSEQGILGPFHSQLFIIQFCWLPSPPRCLSKGFPNSALTKHWEEPAGKPDHQGEAHSARVFQHSFRGDKDAAANHAADEKRESPQQSYLFPQKDSLLFFLVFPHGCSSNPRRSSCI